jgi:para-nitrobenzyl esterase
MIAADTPSGRLLGDPGDAAVAFRGIPYAQPPVGDRRFRPPEPGDPWSGDREAVEFSAGAMQPDAISGAFPEPRREDCLYLNVWAPLRDGELHQAAGDPVMVWFHGGGYRTGSGSVPWYDGANLARRGAVIVTVNYRLGPLGFCHLERIGGSEWADSGMLGTLDQCLALEWVRDHCASFGGNPANVTIFGESAGGMSVGTHLGLERSRGLFHRAIAQSGAARHVHEDEVGERVARAVLDAVGVSPSRLDELYDVPAQAFVDCQATVDAGDGAELAMPFSPTVGCASLPTPPEVAIAAGASADIDLLVGTNSEEMRMFLLTEQVAGEVDEARLQRRVARALAHHEVIADPHVVIDTYRKRLGDVPPGDVWISISSDLVFRVPAIALAQAHMEHGPTRMYLSTHASDAFGGLMGAGHATEIPFVFDNLDQGGVDIMLGDITDARRTLAAAVADSWVSFARTGDPGAALGDWPRYEGGERTTMMIDVDSGSESDPWSDERRIWID